MAIANRILPILYCALAASPNLLQTPLAVTCQPGETVAFGPRELTLNPGFTGRAALVVVGPCKVVVKGWKVDGARAGNAQPQPLPPSDRRFADHYAANGLLIIGALELTVADSELREIARFAILASNVLPVRIRNCRFQDSGSTNAKGRNNTTGGVLLEDGTADFVVENNTFDSILGNALWTHSRYRSTRNGPGLVQRNRFQEIDREAIQTGHATSI